jgi:vitamin B12/bleomycin/antimicrobial peptide transport system ATP-binding/permease protein
MNKIEYLKRLGKWYWHLTYPYWFSREKFKAFGILLAIIVMILLNARIEVLNNGLQGEYMTALSNKNIDDFYRLLLITTATSFLWFGLLILKGLLLTKLGLYWRQWLTEYFLNKYFTRNNFYKINNDTNIDNPDQRISEDVHTFIDKNALIISLIETTLSGFIFISILAAIDLNLVFVAFISAIIKIAIVFTLGRILTPLNFENLRSQADFRYNLIQARNHSESIALYGGQARELTTISQRFRDAIDILHRMVIPSSSLSAFSTFTSIAVGIIPILILAPRFFAGAIQFGDISRAISAFYSVIASFTWIANNFEQLSLFAVILKRLGILQESFDRSKIIDTTQQNNKIEIVEGNCFDLSNVTLQTPDNSRNLIEDLSITVSTCESLLIMGASGKGKSALVKAIAGLWTAGTGRIIRPQRSGILFLPQRPYIGLGSLRDRLTYPHNDRHPTDKELQASLVLANLEDLVERVGGWDLELNWTDILSLGEQQRLAFARLFLSQPRYAILDESTSALDIENEEYLYQFLQKSNTTYISVGHRPTLIPYHQNILTILDNSNWKYSPSQESIESTKT